MVPVLSTCIVSWAVASFDWLCYVRESSFLTLLDSVRLAVKVGTYLVLYGMFTAVSQTFLE